MCCPAYFTGNKEFSSTTRLFSSLPPKNKLSSSSLPKLHQIHKYGLGLRLQNVIILNHHPSGLFSLLLYGELQQSKEVLRGSVLNEQLHLENSEDLRENPSLFWLRLTITNFNPVISFSCHFFIIVGAGECNTNGSFIDIPGFLWGSCLWWWSCYWSKCHQDKKGGGCCVNSISGWISHVLFSRIFPCQWYVS